MFAFLLVVMFIYVTYFLVYLFTCLLENSITFLLQHVKRRANSRFSYYAHIFIKIILICQNYELKVRISYRSKLVLQRLAQWYCLSEVYYMWRISKLYSRVLWTKWLLSQFIGCFLAQAVSESFFFVIASACLKT